MEQVNLKEALTSSPAGGAGAGLTPGLLTIVCDRDTRIAAVTGTWPGGGSPNAPTLRELIHPDDHDLVGSVLSWLRTGKPVDHAVSVHIDVGSRWVEAAMIAAAHGEELVFTFVAVLPDPAQATIDAVFAERELAATLDEALHVFADLDEVWATVHYARDADSRYTAVTASTGQDTFRRAVEAAVGGELRSPWDAQLAEDPVTISVDDMSDGLKMAARHAGFGAVMLVPVLSATGHDVGCLALWCENASRLEIPGVAVLIERAMPSITLAFQIETGRDGIRRLATRDPLTGLWNRQAFFGQLRSSKAQRGCTVACIDIDAFARINTRFGHSVGDDVLVEVANRLRDAMRPGDVIARMSADEFAVICPEVRTEDAASAIAHRIVGIAERPFLLAGNPTEMSFSVGVAVADEDRGGAALFQDAERAMLEVKAAEHGSWLFA